VLKKIIPFAFAFVLPMVFLAADQKSELAEIDLQIQELKNQLHDQQTQEIREEVKGQRLSIADWNSYAKEIKKINKRNEREELIQQRIEQLKKQKKTLLQSEKES